MAGRCLSRLSRPDEAETYYKTPPGPLDLEDRHIRAYALVVNNRREPAIQAYREYPCEPTGRRARSEPNGARS